jgi:hypothetical protein
VTRLCKRQVAVLAALALWWVPMAAHPRATWAGSYPVFACGGAAGGTQNAFAAAADPGMTAYSICPNTPNNVLSGLVTRASATAGPGSVRYLAGAYQIFEAPPGASLESVTFDVAVIRLASHWTTAIMGYDNDFNFEDLPYGCYAPFAGCGIGSRSFFGPVTVGLNGRTRFRFQTRCGNPAGCDISGSSFVPATRALFSAANVAVRVQDWTAPEVMPWGGSLFGGGWLRGYHAGYSGEFDNVGIMLSRTWVDGSLVDSEDFRVEGYAPLRCDFTRRRPCSDVGSAGSPVNTAGLADGPHQVRVEAVDAAGNGGSATRTILTDNTAPARVNAAVAGGESWRRTNDFTVGWSSSGDQAAPIARAHYRLCKEGGESCSEGSQTGAGIDRLDHLRPPSQGDYTLQAWLEDAAGNSDPATRSDPVHLRFDDVPPELAAFELLDEYDPRRIDVLVGDGASGVAGGIIEMRRAGNRQWHALATTLSLDASRISSYLDDLSLPDGTYEFRARVLDRAGNERVSDRREDGSKMQLTLPLRTTSHLTISAPARHRARCKPRRRHRCGRRGRNRNVSVRGTAALVSGLLGTSGGPVGGALVGLLEEPRTGGGFRFIGTVQTNGAGRFAHKLSRGPSRTIRFRYDGTPLIKPAVRDLKVLVPARSTIHASRGFLQNGQSVRFIGRLLARPVPDGGKLVDLQAFYRGKWRTFAVPRTDSDGRWALNYRFEATHGLVRYRFRARIRREAAYPYELGYSRTVGVTVRG